MTVQNDFSLQLVWGMFWPCWRLKIDRAIAIGINFPQKILQVWDKDVLPNSGPRKKEQKNFKHPMVQNQKKNKRQILQQVAGYCWDTHLYTYKFTICLLYYIFICSYHLHLCLLFLDWFSAYCIVLQHLCKYACNMYPTLGGRNLAFLWRLACCRGQGFPGVSKNVDNIFPILGAYGFGTRQILSRTQFDVRSCHTNWSLWGHHVIHGFPQSYL